MVKVLNKYHFPKGLPEDSIYIGRGSPYGNPFKIGEDGTREEVIQKFREYLYSNYELRKKVISELVGKDLVCYCAPKLCHGDVYIELINSYYSNLDTLVEEEL